MQKYITPAYMVEKLETEDVICASRLTPNIYTESENEYDGEGNVINTFNKTVVETSFAQLFGN